MKEQLQVKGMVKFLLTDEQGKVKLDMEVPNLVVSAGRSFIASRMVNASSAVMSHMAVGTSSTAPSAGDTTLGGEVGRVALTSSVLSSSDITYSATFGAGVGTGALQEAGILNAASSGTLLCRTTFPLINKGSSDTLQITWTVSVS